MDTTLIIAEDAPPLSRSPWRFALYFYLKSRYTLAAIFVFEAAQAACTILLPYAVKEIIDAVTLAKQMGADIFATSTDALILFASLNLGIVLFSRASGAMLVMTGPYLRREIRKSLFSYLQHHSHRYFISHFAGSLASRIAEVVQRQWRAGPGVKPVAGSLYLRVLFARETLPGVCPGFRRGAFTGHRQDSRFGNQCDECENVRASAI